MDSQIITPETKQVVLSRGVTKTGQATSYMAGDDGDYEAGWWVGRLNANNRQRFITKTISGDVIVLDKATGLMWAQDLTAAGCGNGLCTYNWAAAIGYANALNFAGFSDWRIPNLKELISILEFGDAPQTYTFYTPLKDGIACSAYWSSNTFGFSTTLAWLVRFLNYDIKYEPKSNQHGLRCVRRGL